MFILIFRPPPPPFSLRLHPLSACVCMSACVWQVSLPQPLDLLPPLSPLSVSVRLSVTTPTLSVSLSMHSTFFHPFPSAPHPLSGPESCYLSRKQTKTKTVRAQPGSQTTRTRDTRMLQPACSCLCSLAASQPAMFICSVTTRYVHWQRHNLLCSLAASVTTRLFLPVFIGSVTTRLFLPMFIWQRHNPPVPAYVHLAATQPACSCLCSFGSVATRLFLPMFIGSVTTRLFPPMFIGSVTTRLFLPMFIWQRHNPPVPAYVHLAVSQPACSFLCSLVASPPTMFPPMFIGSVTTLLFLPMFIWQRHNPPVPAYVHLAATQPACYCLCSFGSDTTRLFPPMFTGSVTTRLFPSVFFGRHACLCSGISYESRCH